MNDENYKPHVLLIDEFDNRVQFMMANYDLSKSRAAQVVRAEDKRRKNLYQKLRKTDYDNPFLYHLVLNMSKVSLEQALELVCKLVDPSKY